MLNDVIFNNEKSAYDEWNIVLTKSEISLPTPKTSMINIKGADGSLDLSEALTGDIFYNNRTIKLTFEMMDDADYYNLISDISNYLHGRIITVRLTKDEDYYYIGRASIKEGECSKRKGMIVISVECEPYKYAVTETVRTITVSNQTKTITLPNNRKKICPNINATGTVKLIVGDVEYDLVEGEQQLISFVLIEGDNIVKISGNGTVIITYRQGAL